MAEKGTRQLAAIMFADMVGFTALMQEDEERARIQRDRHRDVLDSLVPRHNGEILQYYGDGTLSVFQSAVEAVECAVQVQLELQTDPVVPLRIGVHTGDIVHDRDGVYGDGVNVAARIESLSTPGGVLISGKVYDEIKNHPSLSAVAMGPVQLKNVKRPLLVFAVSNEGLSVPDPEEVGARVEGEGIGTLAVSVSSDGAIVGTLPVDLEPAGPGEAFIQAVRKRSLVQWGLTYLAGAWVVIQVVGFASIQFGWPSHISRSLDLLAFVGFFVALVVTWYHGERGPQRIKGSEVLLIGSLLAVAGIALSAVGPGEGSSPSAERLPVEAATDPRPSIAVLPFDNFSPDPEDAYFSNGVQEDITSALSRIRTLRVPGRSSVDQYRTSRPSTQEIAAALGADYLLEGSARIVGGRVRVTVQLIDGRTNEHIWTEDYDSEFSVEQVIAIQSEVAQEVAFRLEAMITPEDSARISTIPTRIPRAFELAQRAKYRWNMRTEEGVRESVRLFQEAIDLDPEYAEAYAGLADAYLVLANWGWMDHREAYAWGIAAADQALQLDPGIASAHASLGGLHLWSTRDWVQSEEYFLTAVELDPDYGYGHYWYSALLSALGRHSEAIAQAEEAARVDPLSPAISYGLARSHFVAGDFERAIQEARLALEVHPDYGNLHSLLCSAHISAGSLQEAETACLRHQRATGVPHSLNMGILRAHQGNRTGALAEVDGVIQAREDGELQPVIIAMVHAGLGDLDETLRWLRLALDEDYPHLEYLSTHPFFDSLRQEPRYQGLLRELGLQNRP